MDRRRIDREIFMCYGMDGWMDGWMGQGFFYQHFPPRPSQLQQGKTQTPPSLQFVTKYCYRTFRSRYPTNHLSFLFLFLFRPLASDDMMQLAAPLDIATLLHFRQYNTCASPFLLAKVWLWSIYQEQLLISSKLPSLPCRLVPIMLSSSCHVDSFLSATANRYNAISTTRTFKYTSSTPRSKQQRTSKQTGDTTAQRDDENCYQSTWGKPEDDEDDGDDKEQEEVPPKSSSLEQDTTATPNNIHQNMTTIASSRLARWQLDNGERVHSKAAS